LNSWIKSDNFEVDALAGIVSIASFPITGVGLGLSIFQIELQLIAILRRKPLEQWKAIVGLLWSLESHRIGACDFVSMLAVVSALAVGFIGNAKSREGKLKVAKSREGMPPQPAHANKTALATKAARAKFAPDGSVLTSRPNTTSRVIRSPLGQKSTNPKMAFGDMAQVERSVPRFMSFGQRP